MKKFFKLAVLLLILIISFIVIVNFYVLSFSKDGYYKNVDEVEKNFVGLVFGASVIGKTTPSDILQDRLKVAYEAYKIGKILKIIVSGDNSRHDYNEPVAMQRYLIDLGVDVDDIYLDYAGFDTYDSIYRAKNIFQLEKMTLFTQDFHLKRAMYISKRLGLETMGVETNLQVYLNRSYNNRREVFARIKAFLEVEIFKTKATGGDVIEIITDEKIDEAKNKILK